MEIISYFESSTENHNESVFQINYIFLIKTVDRAHI